MYTCGVMARFHLPLRRKQNVMALGSNWGVEIQRERRTRNQAAGGGGAGGGQSGRKDPVVIIWGKRAGVLFHPCPYTERVREAGGGWILTTANRWARGANPHARTTCFGLQQVAVLRDPLWPMGCELWRNCSHGPLLSPQRLLSL